jgi:S1-C subfamily serine protease
MWKSLLASLSLLLLVACSQAPKPFDFAKQIDETSVEVTIMAGGSCSGTIIDDHTVLTAGHCSNFGDWKDFTVNVQGKELIARLRKFDKDKDLAVLDVPGVKFKHWVKIAEHEPTLADDVWCVGNPGGKLPDTITKGIVSFVNRISKDLGLNNKRNQMDCAIHLGNSGGGIFNSKGELIGVVSSGMMFRDQFGNVLQFGTSHMFAITVSDIRDFLDLKTEV